MSGVMLTPLPLGLETMWFEWLEFPALVGMIGGFGGIGCGCANAVSGWYVITTSNIDVNPCVISFFILLFCCFVSLSPPRIDFVLKRHFFTLSFSIFHTSTVFIPLDLRVITFSFTVCGEQYKSAIVRAVYPLDSFVETLIRSSCAEPPL